MTQETPPPDDVPAELLELAHAHGVLTEFRGHSGEVQSVAPDTLVAVLEALGVQASTPRQVSMSLALARDEEWRQLLPPTVVVRQGVEATVPVHVTDGASVHVWVEIDGADAGASPRARREVRDLAQLDVYTEPRTIDGRAVGRATFAVPTDLPLGYHCLQATSEGAQARTTLIVTPQRLTLPPALETQVWGLLVQLYSVRSRTSWGMGDLADLADRKSVV